MLHFIPVPLLSLVTTQAFSQAVQGTPAATPVADFGGSLWQLFLGLGLVLVLVVASLWVMKKLLNQHGQNAGLLRVVAGTAVGARERVVIVEVGSTWLVLGVAPGRVSALAEVPRQTSSSLPSDASLAGDGFAGWLSKLTQKK